MRKPFQGVWNIIRFNWHFYLISATVVGLLLFVSRLGVNEMIIITAYGITAIIIGLNLVSLLISWYIYDRSNLYSFAWLNRFEGHSKQKVLNINAGFDETSSLLKNRFPEAELSVFDFYDANKHTEVSIKRARKAYPPFAGTVRITTESLPLKNDSIDTIFCMLSAHEIRHQNEREIFFGELARVLKPSGRIIVTEHLRDLPNFLAYTIGFFHFHSRKSWLSTFRAAHLELRHEIKITPFISSFILKKYGTTS